MTVEEMEKIIKLLRNKKEIAFSSDLQTYKSTGKIDISMQNYLEYSSLVSTLVSGIEKQRPMYVEKYNTFISHNNLMTRQQQLERLEALVNAIETEINNGLIKDEVKSTNDYFPNHEKQIENIFENFSSCCRQARNRYDGRPTIDVKDEFDVQDLLHILLRLYFKDIRPEEYTPSYAGKSSRMDFLIKGIKTVVETKKTRDNLRDKEIGEELTLDIAKYSTHPDCEKLYCFVYDPDGLVRNSKGIESDLSGNKNGLDVQVFIRP
jgi:hypothetical protein